MKFILVRFVHFLGQGLLDISNFFIIYFVIIKYNYTKMPRMSRKYCLSTSPKKMGFSQKASCKSQGFMKRTSKKFKGKYIVSPVKKNKSLYSNGKNKPRIRSGYGSEKIAKQTLKNIKGKSKSYQKQIVNTMYNRSKYHKYQTKDMRKAMKVYKKWINSKK